jgi:hypothetical protein
MKKIYSIQITDCIGRPKIWYADKINRRFDAELRHRPGTGEAVFWVTMSQYVHPIDCKIISERLEEIYKNPK